MTISSRLIQNIVVCIILFFVFLAARWGWGAGTDIANSNFTVRTVYATLRGVDYFFSDQSRYPSTLEFKDPKRLGVYVENFPPQFPTDDTICPESGTYNVQNLRTFTLTFCIPRSSGPFMQGVNVVSEKTFIPSVSKP